MKHQTRQSQAPSDPLRQQESVSHHRLGDCCAPPLSALQSTPDEDHGHGVDALPGSPSKERSAVRTNGDAHIDPVCGMTVMADSEKALDYKGKTYYFCNPKCAEKFSADPHRYLPKRDTTPPSAVPTTNTAKSTNVIYTCPMHPEVRQVGPGSCPKCGIPLEPLEATSEADTRNWRI